MNKGTPFTCSHCGKTFDRDRPDAEAKAEYEKRWGRPYRPHEADIVCDDCFKLMVIRAH